MIILNNGNSFYTSDGKKCENIILTKKYYLVYSLNEFDKKGKLKFKGIDLVKGLSGFRRFAFEEFGLRNDQELLDFARQVIIAWGTLSITQDISYQNYIIEKMGFSLFQAVQDFIQGGNKAKVFLNDAIAAYVALSKNIYANGDMRKNCLNIHDLHWDFMDEVLKKEMMNGWQNHNFTKRNGIKGCDEFVEYIRNGIFDIEWCEI